MHGITLTWCYSTSPNETQEFSFHHQDFSSICVGFFVFLHACSVVFFLAAGCMKHEEDATRMVLRKSKCPVVVCELRSKCHQLLKGSPKTKIPPAWEEEHQNVPSNHSSICNAPPRTATKTAERAQCAGLPFAPGSKGWNFRNRSSCDLNRSSEVGVADPCQ